MATGRMKTNIKYGAIIAAGVVVWVLADHYLVHISRGSKTGVLTPAFFNLLHLIVLFAGIRALRQANQGQLSVGQGIGAGLGISLTYGVLACIFFLSFYLLAGPKILESEPAANARPEKYVLLAAFAGLFLGAMIGGLIYSAVISFALSRSSSAGADAKARQKPNASRRRR